VDIVRGVLIKEGKKINDETIGMICSQARGDVRAALNDLQSVLEVGDTVSSSKREKAESIFDSLKKLFQDETDENTLRIFDNSDLKLDEILLWIEENVGFKEEYFQGFQLWIKLWKI